MFISDIIIWSKCVSLVEILLLTPLPDCTIPVILDLSLGGAHLATRALELGNITPCEHKST